MLKAQKLKPTNSMKDFERKAILSLSKREDIWILPADNRAGVMSSTQYLGKTKELLDDATYVKVSKDPIPKKDKMMNRVIADIKKVESK